MGYYIPKGGKELDLSELTEHTHTELIYNVMLVSSGQQSYSVIHMHIFILFRFFSQIGYHRILASILCATQ